MKYAIAIVVMLPTVILSWLASDMLYWRYFWPTFPAMAELIDVHGDLRPGGHISISVSARHLSGECAAVFIQARLLHVERDEPPWHLPVYLARTFRREGERLGAVYDLSPHMVPGLYRLYLDAAFVCGTYRFSGAVTLAETSVELAGSGGRVE